MSPIEATEGNVTKETEHVNTGNAQDSVEENHGNADMDIESTL